MPAAGRYKNAGSREPVRWVGLALNVTVAVQQVLQGQSNPTVMLLLAALIAALTEVARSKVTPT